MATQQNRIYVTLSPRMRTALNLCSALDGSTPTTYAASLLSSALLQEIEKRPALHERWVEIERNALQKGTWGFIDLNEIDESNEHTSVKVVHSWSLTGNRPQDYVYGKDDTIRYDGKKTSYFKAIKTARAEDNDFGTLSLTIAADNYRKKRLRFSATVKSEGISEVGRVVDACEWTTTCNSIEFP